MCLYAFTQCDYVLAYGTGVFGVTGEENVLDEYGGRNASVEKSRSYERAYTFILCSVDVE